jgi:very-short-patch-repair endonuclease
MKKRNTQQFINDCISIRGNIYDYSLVDYKNNKLKVKIICKEHGIFEQTPNNHLSKKQDCPKCSDYHFDIKSKSDVIVDFIKKHGNKYDYSKVNYKGNKIKVEIICSKHGSFFQTPNNHLKGNNCAKCLKIDTEMFIKKAKKVHKEKYRYDLVNYINMNSKIKIICSKHGIFKQVPHSHIYGVGCPTCQESKGEREISYILEEMKIEFIRQFSFDECKNIKKLRFDFYLPKLNTCIEFDGKQHFESIEFYGGIDEIKKRDEIKNIFCKNKKIILLRIHYKDNIKNKLEECLI